MMLLKTVKLVTFCGKKCKFVCNLKYLYLILRQSLSGV